MYDIYTIETKYLTKMCFKFEIIRPKTKHARNFKAYIRGKIFNSKSFYGKMVVQKDDPLNYQKFDDYTPKSDIHWPRNANDDITTKLLIRDAVR